MTHLSKLGEAIALDEVSKEFDKKLQEVLIWALDHNVPSVIVMGALEMQVFAIRNDIMKRLEQ